MSTEAVDGTDAPIVRKGRRPGPTVTRQAILDAARTRFASDGFAAATVRKIAADAEVDGALVMRFFGSKAELFAAVMSIPASALSRFSESFDGPSDSLGERVTRAFLEVWEGGPETSEPLLALLRAAASNEQVTVQFREFVQARVLMEALSLGLRDEREAAVRAGLAASMLVGVIVGRGIVRVPALVDEDREGLVARIAPAIQAILEPVSAEDSREPWVRIGGGCEPRP